MRWSYVLSLPSSFCRGADDAHQGTSLEQEQLVLILFPRRTSVPNQRHRRFSWPPLVFFPPSFFRLLFFIRLDVFYMFKVLSCTTFLHSKRFWKCFNWSIVISDPPHMNSVGFLDPPLFTFSKIMAHPLFFSGPPPPVLYDQSLKPKNLMYCSLVRIWLELRLWGTLCDAYTICQESHYSGVLDNPRNIIVLHVQHTFGCNFLTWSAKRRREIFNLRFILQRQRARGRKSVIPMNGFPAKAKNQRLTAERSRCPQNLKFYVVVWQTTSNNCTKGRAALAARLLFLIQPIKSLICGVVVVVAVVVS